MVRTSFLSAWFVLAALAWASLSSTARAESREQTAQAMALSAEVLAGEGKLDEAILLFQRVYELDPAPVILYNIARLLDRKGDLPKAREYYERYLGEERDKAGRDKGAARLADLLSRLPGQVVVRPDPADAQVTIDGVALERDRPFEVKPGKHQVAAERAGHVRQEVTVEVAGGKETVVPLTLPPLSGGLNVVMNTPGAQVRIDDRLVGVTPLPEPASVAPGVHTVQILLDGVERFAKVVDVKPGETLTLAPTLAEMRTEPASGLDAGASAPAAVVASAPELARTVEPAPTPAALPVAEQPVARRFPWHFVALGSGVAVAAVGAVLLWYAAPHERAKVSDAANCCLGTSAGSSYASSSFYADLSRAEALAIEDRANAYSVSGVVALAAGGAAVVTGAVLWGRSGRSSRPVVGIGPHGDGLAATFSGSF